MARPDGISVQVIGAGQVEDICKEFGLSLRVGYMAALQAGVVPECYLRNQDALSSEDQIRLLKSRVLLVGLGGLGGQVLEQLTRAGVGRIRAADGDRFEESNLNRQLLATSGGLGTFKTEAAINRACQANPATEVEPLKMFLDEHVFDSACDGIDLVIDALGGLTHRVQLFDAAARARLPLVTAAVAGWAGYTGLVFPGEPGPSQIVGDVGTGVEDVLGTPVPTVAFAASITAAFALQALSGQAAAPGRTLVFDLAAGYFETITLSDGP